jgi:hypothetical protein
VKDAGTEGQTEVVYCNRTHDAALSTITYMQYHTMVDVLP